MGFVGFGLQILAGVIGGVYGDTGTAATIANTFFYTGIVIFVMAVTLYSRNKGYPLWIGLFGLLGPFGALIAAKLPDRTDTTPEA